MATPVEGDSVESRKLNEREDLYLGCEKEKWTGWALSLEW